MDRPVDIGVKQKRIAKRVVIGVVTAGLVVAAILVGPSLITPSLSRTRIRTAVVDSGPIESVTSASGTVVPEVEGVVSTPIDARVVSILKRPGAELRKGDPIVVLDTAASQLEIERLDGAITLKKNAQHQVELELERTLMDLQARVDAKRLDLQSLGSKTAQNRKLGAAGLLSADAVHDSELTEAKSRIELEALESAMRNSKVTSKAKLAGLDLEMQTLIGERDEARRQLELATMTSDRDGVLTWVVAEEGATLTRGAIVARIADLGSFRVDATISDVHAQQLSVGLPVRVKIGDDLLPGVVSNVLPAIQNGTITLSVRLDDPSNPLLRSNLRVDVLIVTDRRESALRIRKGAFATANGSVEAFVISGNRADRRTVRLGMSGVDSYEVVDGMAEGDEVIVSDTRDIAPFKSVTIK